MESWSKILVLTIGGALGVNARYWLGVWIDRWVGHGFPWATFTINVSGCLAIGFLTTLLTSCLPHPHARLMVLVGFLGGFTTFSTYAFESLTLWDRGETRQALVYVMGSVAAGILAAALGVALGRALVISVSSTGDRRAPVSETVRGSSRSDGVAFQPDPESRSLGERP